MEGTIIEDAADKKLIKSSKTTNLNIYVFLYTIKCKWES